MTAEEAEEKYIELVSECKKEHGFDAKATKSANGDAIKAEDLKRFDELVKETGTTY